jgi:hypothetical protein
MCQSAPYTLTADACLSFSGTSPCTLNQADPSNPVKESYKTTKLTEVEPDRHQVVLVPKAATSEWMRTAS